MSTEPLSPDAAWRALRDVRNRAAAAQAAVTIDPRGRWRASGPVSDAARDLLDCLGPVAAHPGRLAIGQLGQSLDGRIATESGHSHYVNGLESRTHLHRLRALVDAVVIGAGTAIADDPRLTVRHVAGANPVRVVLDPRGRVRPDLHLMRCAEAQTIHLVGDAVITGLGPRADHVRRFALPVMPNGGFTPAAVLDALADLGLRRVLVEGGGITVSRFLEAGALQRLHLLVAPLLIGSGRPGLRLTPIGTLDDALRPRTRRFACGDDTLFDLRLA
ncbi:RibD family protein [Ectothiorhodospiraceae bacterium WFHF3C12]|nr:RibD family protein [Ectothiorhodospiraceae bacterium WFHF3C12]